jgi:peptide/nickel transport system substrate-binding protein
MSPASMADPQVDAKPVGTGMFKLGEYVPASSYSVERWDGYWDPDAVKVAGIDVVGLPDSAARNNALRSGEIDIAPVEPADVETIEAAEDVSVLPNKTLRYVYLAMNLAKTPLDDLKVRQAISYALDRQALLDGPYFGLGEITEQPWPDGYFPHVAELEGTYPHDVEKAKQLLAEAGYPDGFTADIIVVPSPTVYTQLGEAVQAQLAEVGITLNIQLTEPAELGQAMYIDKTAAFALLYTNGAIDPANTVGSRFASTGFFNAGKYSTPHLEELYQQALATTDEDDRTTVMQDVSREVVEQVLDMPIFFALEPLGVNDRVVGFESYLTGRPEYRGVGVTG